MFKAIFGKFAGLNVYAKALVAFAGAFGTFLVTILAEQSVAHVLPPSWLLFLGTIASVLTGIATYAKKNADPNPVSAYEKARAEAEAAAAKADAIAKRLPNTPGEMVDHVIDTARGTIDRIF